MDKRLLVIGLIGGILAIAGVFTAWATMDMSGTLMGETISVSVSVSGMDMARGEMTVMGTTQSVPSESYPYIALAGGILALIGALGVLASPGLRKLGILLAIGGILAIVGAGWGFSDIETGTISVIGLTASVGYGYGLYLCLIGGILGLVGVLGLRGK